MSAARLLFAGTPEFALRSLQHLVEAGRPPVAVLTQPDRRAGRGRKLTPGPVKSFAADRGIAVLQPVSLKDPAVPAALAELRPDLLIVAAYGMILPPAVLQVPRLGCINVHASLLPRWRGAAPVQHAILAGDDETGVCLMQMDAGLDTGPVYDCAATPIHAADTGGTLLERLASMGGELLVAALDDILAGRRKPQPQDDARATYAGKIGRGDAALQWAEPAQRLARAVRAYNPAPGAWFELAGEPVKCWRAEACSGGPAPPGVVTAAGGQGIDVACGRGTLRLLDVQRPGRRPVSGRELSAQFDLVGKRLG